MNRTKRILYSCLIAVILLSFSMYLDKNELLGASIVFLVIVFCTVKALLKIDNKYLDKRKTKKDLTSLTFIDYSFIKECEINNSKPLKKITSVKIYNLILTIAILTCGYSAYNNQQIIVDDHVYWTAQTTNAEFMRRQRKINYE